MNENSCIWSSDVDKGGILALNAKMNSLDMMGKDYDLVVTNGVYKIILKEEK